MAESLEMMTITPTIEDTIRNRFIEFLIYVLTEFNQYAYQLILVSADKKNAKTNEFTKYLCKAVDAGVTSTITVASSGAGAGVGKSIGKITSDSVGKLIDHYGKSKQHTKSKIAEHLLQGFQHDDKKWIKFLLDAFSDIFITFNVQFLYLLRTPVDAWTKAKICSKKRKQ